MSYRTIAQCVGDNEFTQRVVACFSQEGNNPNNMPNDLLWDVAGKSDIETAYAYALDTDNPSPGGDETVITDQMILSAVQAITAPPPPDVLNPT